MISNEPVTRALEAPDFIVDEDRGALLNTNDRSLDAYRKQREQARKNVDMQERLTVLESSLEEIKVLLQQALTKK